VNADLRRVAASLPAAERSGDRARVAALLSRITTVRELAELTLLLARCADWSRLNAETGYIAASTPRELHAYYVRLRSRGVPKEDIAPHIRDGESEYQRQSRADRVSGRKPRRSGRG